jgi:DNA repair protein RadC
MQIKLDRKIKISGSQSVAELVRGILAEQHPFDQDKELMIVIGLTQSNTVKYIDIVSMGSLKGTVAEPREVFRMAIHMAAASIILTHNHPSQNSEPSNSDKTTTKELVSAGKVLRIQVVDHVIVCDDSFFSFADEGLI